MAFTPGLGIQVERAAVALPAGAGSVDLFVVAGGACLITYMIARAAVGFGAGPGNANFDHDVIPNDISLLAAVGGAALDTRWWVTGDPGVAAVTLDPTAIGSQLGGYRGGGIAAGAGILGHGLVVVDGNIRYTVSADLTPGEVSAVLYYLPLERGATIVSA